MYKIVPTRPNNRLILKGNKSKFDLVYLVLVVSLLLIGMLLVYDASVNYSLVTFNNKYFFLYKHISWVIMGMFGFFILSFINLEIIKRLTVILLGLTTFLLVLVLLPTPFAPNVYGAKRWLILNPHPLPDIPLLGSLSFQPSELAKLAGIIYLATLLTSVKKRSPIILNLNFVALCSILCGLVLLQPNYSTSMIIAISLGSMYFLSGEKLKLILIELPVFLVFAVIYALSSAYRRSRIMTLLGDSGTNNLDAGYHIKQILIALGSGGMFGLGLGSSVQKYSYLPEVTADSIFAVLGEELGFMGTSTVVILYIFLILRCFKIAREADSKFESLVAYGITTWIGTQTIINLFAMVKLFPITGIPLPLISYGGSSTVILLFAMGILFNISRHKKSVA